MAPKVPCKYFQLGTCKQGDKCTFKHVVDPNFKRQPCKNFAKGHCRYGKTCRFSHEEDAIDELKAATSPLSDSTEAKFNEWRYGIPRDVNKVRKLGTSMSKFWSTALELVDGDAGLMQEVITLLANEGGMIRVAELLDQPFDELSDAQLARVFDTQLLPFFNVVTHRNVNSSAILEGRVMTIYNYVFGHGGQRGVEVFRAVVRHLATLNLGEGVTGVDAEKSILAFEASTSALARLFEVNTTAQINHGFISIAESLSALLCDVPDTLAARNVLRQLERVQRRRGLGGALPVRSERQDTSASRPKFILAREMPGELSEIGPRHDNDKAEIRNISILPTQQEIQSSRNEYLPVSNPSAWHLSGLEGPLDRNFRLLREDTIGQLRDAAKFELERLQNPRANVQSNKRQGARTYVYDNIAIENVTLDAFRGMEFAVGFDQPAHLKNRSKKHRRDWWEGSKRLGADALVCLLDAEGSAKFLVVAPPPTNSRSDGDDENAIQLHEEYNLWEDDFRAYVIARPVKEEDIRPLLHQSPDSDETHLSLVEFPGVLLPAFMPTLKAMQRMSESLDMPFCDIIAPAATPADPDVEIEIGLPAYATRPGFRYDLSKITSGDHQLHFTPGTDIETAAGELEQNSSLDAAQANALISSLSRKLSLIQGPPGTGKS